MTNYSNFQIPYKYKGFKTYVSYKIKTFRVFEDEKVIEYHPDFINNLNGYQRFFILTWCIKFHKMRSYERATQATMAVYKQNGLPEADCIDLLNRINENKQISKFILYNILMFESKNEIKSFFYALIKKIKSIFIHKQLIIKQNGN